MGDSAPPPPPPPHGQSPRPPGQMPDGNYDIFIVPPHSAGAGFLYLPSLQTDRNSFIAGIAVTLAAVGIYTVVMPVLRAWLQTVMAGNAWGVLVLVVIVGVGAWAFGKTSGEWQNNSTGPENAGRGPPPGWNNSWFPGAGAKMPPPQGSAQSGTGPAPQPQQSQQQGQQQQGSSAQTGWEKAREETKKREEARKRTEEFERKRAEAAKAREDAATAAKAKAEKEKWEQARAREKEQRERETRDRTNKDPTNKSPLQDKEARSQSIRERMEKLRRERDEKEKRKAASATGPSSPPKKEYVRPTARSAVGTEDQYSYRPYDTPPKPARTGQPFHSSASSVSGLSESSYAASQTTAQTTPPSRMGPYSTQDPDKIQIRAVYLFKDSFPNKPISSLVVGQNSVSDGLILHIGTEGLFIDDDVRKVPQREWDVKAWTLKLVEDGGLKGTGVGLHVLRATVRNADSSKYIFIFDESEGWKIAKGLERLRKGSQTRSLGTSGMKDGEVRGLLATLGWI